MVLTILQVRVKPYNIYMLEFLVNLNLPFESLGHLVLLKVLLEKLLHSELLVWYGAMSRQIDETI